VSSAAPALTLRIARSLSARLRSVRASPALSPVALREAWTSRRGGHPVDEAHGPHLEAALDWLCRAQDATPDDGFARAWALAWNAHFRAAGWQPSYPETTGYIIPTLYSAARLLGRPALAERAGRAARWEVAVQLPSGAVRGGVVGEAPSPAAFNTGQVILGWLAAWEETGDAAFAAAAARAARFLAGCEEGGRFARGSSRFARGDATAYNARAAWALAEAGRALGEPSFVDAAARVLRATAAARDPSGWFPGCCLYDPARPLLHTLAYAVRGLLEGGRVLEDADLVRAAETALERLAEQIGGDGWMSGRYARDWRPAAEWSCVTGQAQIANNWLRLREVTGDGRWLEPAARSIRFVKRTQNRAAPEDGLRGGIPGSWPVDGEYGRYEVLNWAAKFFADALMRHTAATSPGGGRGGVSQLA
jgi:hypothetical protein